MQFPRMLRTISMEEFGRWQPALRIIVHDHARRFAALDFAAGQPSMALSWRSDLIEPTLVASDQSEIWLGVDQRLACVASDGRILLSLGLASNLLQLRRFDECVVTLCETEAVIFNNDYSIRTIHGLVDVPSDLLHRSGALFVSFDDGHEEKIG